MMKKNNYALTLKYANNFVFFQRLESNLFLTYFEFRRNAKSLNSHGW